MVSCCRFLFLLFLGIPLHSAVFSKSLKKSKRDLQRTLGKKFYFQAENSTQTALMRVSQCDKVQEGMSKQYG